MSLKFKYILFIAVLHIILISLIYLLLLDRKLIFILSELLVIISLFLSYQLFKAFIKPLDLLQSGTDAIADADFSIKYLKTGSTEVDKLVDVYNSMIEQLRKERISMSEQSFFVQKLIEASPIGIIIMDYDGMLSNVNPTAQKILNINKNWKEKKLDDYPSELTSLIQETDTSTNKIISVNGIEKYKCQVNEVMHQGFKRKFVLLDDLSKEILQSEKEAYGRIIRMMAHEVNNSMGAINSILDSVLELGFEDEGDIELKNALIIARDRNTSLSQFMANYASILRLPSPQKQKIDLQKILKKCGYLFRPQANQKNISIDFDFPLDRVNIYADETLLEQAISNILKNSIESIGQDGEIIIKCTDHPKQLIISDNGPGISAAAETKLFTPFFSTKPTGQGVGLMLIRDILLNHQASFSLATNQQTQWTHFTVKF